MEGRKDRKTIGHLAVFLHSELVEEDTNRSNIITLSGHRSHAAIRANYR
jgi:hypothetical protein